MYSPPHMTCVDMCCECVSSSSYDTCCELAAAAPHDDRARSQISGRRQVQAYIIIMIMIMIMIIIIISNHGAATSPGTHSETIGFRL